IRDVGALAMGSTTYEWMLRHVLKLGSEAAEPWPYAQPTWGFSTRDLPKAAGADLRFVRGDVRPVHAQMCAAANGKNVWLVGGGDLVGQFHDTGLLGEVIIGMAWVFFGVGGTLLQGRTVE